MLSIAQRARGWLSLSEAIGCFEVVIMGKKRSVRGWIAQIQWPIDVSSILCSLKLKKKSGKGTSDVHFYNHRAPPYGFMSNFYKAQILIDDKTWPTTEHYFQAMKFAGVDDLVERIRSAESPGKAAGLGRSKKFQPRKDWNKDFVDKHGRVTRVKLEVMRRALRAKFDQHLCLREKLLATKGRKLVESTAKDRYWGDGGDGSGKNMLGTLLMELRDDLIREEEEKLRKQGRRQN